MAMTDGQMQRIPHAEEAWLSVDPAFIPSPRADEICRACSAFSLKEYLSTQWQVN